MSPIVIIVFAPVVVIGLVFFALLLGAVAAGIWEAAEARTERRMSAPRQAPPQERAVTRAA
jgi:predicted membrane metal-binding protein